MKRFIKKTIRFLFTFTLIISFVFSNIPADIFTYLNLPQAAKSVRVEKVFANTSSRLPTSNSITSSPGWTFPEKAYDDDDGVNTANTATQAKNIEWGNQWRSFGFDNIVPTNAVINSVKIQVKYKVAIVGSGVTATLKIRSANTGVEDCATQTKNDTSSVLTLTTVDFDFTGCRTWMTSNLVDAKLGAVVIATWTDSGLGVSVAYDLDYVKYIVDFTPDPNATSYVNATESALNSSACATTGCGARITTGGTNQQVTLTGVRLGIATAGIRASCASAIGSNGGCIRIGNYTVPDANITTWTDTSIVFTIPSTITAFGGSGTTCGSADGNGICVTFETFNDLSVNEFWVFPDVTAVSPSGVGEAKEGDTITITGNRFNTVTGTITFQNCGTASGSIGTWNDTSITVTVPAGITDSDDSCDILVTRASGTGSKTKVSTGFVVLPSIVSLTVCSLCNANAGREHATGVDTDGIVMLNGSHLGISAGTVAYTGTGGFASTSATVHSTAEGACSTGGWASSGSSVCIEVNTSIPDSAYTGTITLTRTGDSKLNVWSAFRVLPRITSNDPTSGIARDANPIKITGNHFCQSGTCPVSPNRSDATADNVKFGTTKSLDSDFSDLTGGAGVCNGTGVAWNHSEICVKIPLSLIVSVNTSEPTIIRSNSLFDSNTKAFTVLSETPSDPTSLNQFKSSALTNAISVGTIASSTPVYFTMTMEVPSVTGGTLYPEMEYKYTVPFTAFGCTGTSACAFASSTGATGVAGAGPVNCALTGNACAIAVSPVDNVYHWQARVRHNRNGQDFYSNWVSFGGNAETATDFKIDTVAPVISNVASNVLTTNSAVITWTTGEAGTSQTQYNKTGTFVTLCSTNNDCTAITDPAPPGVTSHSVTLRNVDSASTYSYRVRSKDEAGNEAISSILTFITGSVTAPAKTTKFKIVGANTNLAASTATSTVFTVYMPETSGSPKSVFVQIEGIVTTTSGSPGLTVGVNAEATKLYAFPTSAKNHFKILHSVSSINTDPTTNTLTLTTSANTSIDVSSAEIIVMYAFTP